MKAFRAPGFVEGTFGMECLLDELAAKLEIDPLEIRRRNYAHSTDERPYSSKNLMECYERAEKHWARRDEVRARSDATWKRGVGLASQVWYGGGGPPSYAWIRLGSDGRATVVTAMQDIGTGSKTAMQQIAAEELGLPLERVEISAGDSARGPYASISAGSSTIPSMGPAVRAAAADAARQVIEIAAQRYDKEERTLSLKGGNVVCSDGGSWPLEEVVGLLEDAQILGKGARGPNPTGMQVLTFGAQVAEVAVDVETGEVRVERVAAIHDVGRVINPLGASSQGEGGIIQGIGHTLSEERLLDPETGRIAHADAGRIQDADDRRRAGDRLRAARRPGPAPDEPRLEGARRAADRPGRRRDRERDPRRDRRRRPLAADHARGDAARARGGGEAAARAREGHRVTLDVFLESGDAFDREAVGSSARAERRAAGKRDRDDGRRRRGERHARRRRLRLRRRVADAGAGAGAVRRRADARGSRSCPPTARRTRSSPARRPCRTSSSRSSCGTAAELYEALRQSEELRGARTA